MEKDWLNKIVYKTESCISSKISDKYMNKPIDSHVKHVNLYWKVGNNCNADCSMCAFHSPSICNQDIEKFIYICNTLFDAHTLHSIHVTGGEPGLYIDMIGKCMEQVRKYDKDTLICSNSNGIYLSDYIDMMLSSDMDIVNISRHHYLDSLNNDVFKTNTVAQTEDIVKAVNKVYIDYPDMIHLNCVLMRGYIDSAKELSNYLEYVAGVKVMTSGIVNLMDVNEFCKEHFINFLDFASEFESLSNVTKTRTYEKRDKGCRCCDYLYQATREDGFGGLITVYNRHVINRDSSAGTLVYDGKYLRQGFDGNIIF